MCVAESVKLFLDMDGVLVHQTGRDGFDLMPWMPDGQELGEFVKLLNPVILSQLSPDIFERGSVQKAVWCKRELGGVTLIVERAWAGTTGKHVYAERGAVLIDDHPDWHEKEWTRRGGIFLHHVSARQTIEALQLVL